MLIRDSAGPDPLNQVNPGDGLKVYDTSSDPIPKGVKCQLDATGMKGVWVTFTGNPNLGMKIRF